MTSTDLKTLHISVVIPTLNEQENIAKTIQHAFCDPIHEVLVVDGGSTDHTVAIAESSGAKVLTSLPGRARQMNAGANIATGSILLFIHGDTLLPSTYSQQIVSALAPPEPAAGAFTLSVNLQTPGIRFIESMANIRARIFQMPYGDQGLFLKKQVFQELNGFPDLPFLEDVEMVKRRKKKGKIKIVRQAVLTSGRRWQEKGLIRNTLLNQFIMLAYLLGFSPNRLKGWYVLGKKR